MEVREKALRQALEHREKGYRTPVAIPAGIPTIEPKVVTATSESLAGYGTIVTDPYNHPVEIVRWPAQGWRAIDPDTGDEAGTTEGIFSFWWQGEVLYGRNEAVKDAYLLGWSRDPAIASESMGNPDRSRVLLWHVNYHPDGGQLFYPLDKTPFVVPLAKPGDDLEPRDFVAFYCDGNFGVCLHPNVWHEGVFPLAPSGRFFDKQGRVHARVSCNMPAEFGVLLSVPLREPE
jgi:ureidoglycolate lyase